jgi:2-methylisocitrate lyase-like PEP mutase family enzyme
MVTQAEKVGRFEALHGGPAPFVLPNPWDRGSAKLLVSLGFEALATTSMGFAATLGRFDGAATRDEVLANAAAIVGAVSVPVSADLENGYADDPDGVAETVRLARHVGLAGCSIEDFTGNRDDPFYELEHAVDRVAAAAGVAHDGPVRLVLTARAENFIEGRPDLGDTIARLQRYQEAGADVLFAPGVTDPQQLRSIVAEVDRPVNAMIFPGLPPVGVLAEIGVRRISTGPGFFFAAFGAVVHAAAELRDHGTYQWAEGAMLGMSQAFPAFR